MVKQLFTREAWVKTRLLTATLVAGTGAGTGGSRSSPLWQKRGSNGGGSTLVGDSMGECEWEIHRQTELSVKMEDRATLEDDRPVEVDGLGAPSGCSYEATCSSSSSAGSSRTVLGGKGEV